MYFFKDFITLYCQVFSSSHIAGNKIVSRPGDTVCLKFLTMLREVDCLWVLELELVNIFII